MIKCEKAEILIAMEHTGLYSLPLSVFLMENNYRFVLISGLEIKRSLGIQRGKDDVIDAKRIAEYAYQKKDKIKPTQLPVKNILQIRRLLSLRERLVKQRAGYLMDKGENEIFLNQDENKILFEVIEQSIEYLNFQMDKVEKELYTIVKSDELMKNQFELITSIKGVGKLTALFMIAFTHCFTSFDNWRQFASYAGTAPFPYRSGTSIKGKNKVSNLANKRLKTLLNMCARSAIVCNPEMKIYFQNRKAKGENGMSAINIIRNKLLSRIFAVIKRGTPYVNTLKYAA